MVCFKGFQWDGGLYLSVVDAEDAPAESGSSFRVHRSLHRHKAAQLLTIEPFSFAQRFSIRVERGANGGSEACYLQSVHHDRSSLITEFFILGHQIITRKAQWGLALLLHREFGYIPLYREWMERVLACCGHV